MAKLVWDATGEKFFETGTKNGVIYVQNSDGTYGDGVAWSGLTGITESPTGAEDTKLYADDILYATMKSAEELEGTITAYTYPDEFAECDGSAAVSGGLYFGQQDRKKFALCYRTQIGNDTSDNVAYKLHIIYGISVSPSEKAYSTINDSPEAIEFSWSFKATPINVGTINDVAYKPTASVVIDSRDYTSTTDKGYLTALENVLYGTDAAGGSSGTDATLPTPAEIYSYLTTGAAPVTTP